MSISRAFLLTASKYSTQRMVSGHVRRTSAQFGCAGAVFLRLMAYRIPSASLPAASGFIFTRAFGLSSGTNSGLTHRTPMIELRSSGFNWRLLKLLALMFLQVFTQTILPQLSRRNFLLTHVSIRHTTLVVLQPPRNTLSIQAPLSVKTSSVRVQNAILHCVQELFNHSLRKRSSCVSPS